MLRWKIKFYDAYIHVNIFVIVNPLISWTSLGRAINLMVHRLLSMLYNKKFLFDWSIAHDKPALFKCLFNVTVQGTKIRPLWGTAQLFMHPRYMHGGATR